MSRLRPGRFYTRRDSNEAPIVACFRAHGFHVDFISGHGVPDLLVSRAGRMWLVEVKTAKGKPKPAQLAWRAAFQGPPAVTVRSAEEAMALIVVWRHDAPTGILRPNSVHADNG